MAWQWFIFPCIILFSLMIVGLLVFAFYRNKLVGPGEDEVTATKSWMIAFTGPLAVIAALVASIPVFMQYDALRAGSITQIIDVIRHTLETIDRESATVYQIEGFVDDTDKFKEKSVCRSELWNTIQNTTYGFQTTPDRPDELAHPRAKIADSLAELLEQKRNFCEGRSQGLYSYIQEQSKRLSDEFKSYQEGYHQYTLVRLGLILSYQEDLHYDYTSAVNMVNRYNLKNRNISVAPPPQTPTAFIGEGVKICQLISDSGARLQCFDALSKNKR